MALKTRPLYYTRLNSVTSFICEHYTERKSSSAPRDFVQLKEVSKMKDKIGGLN